MRACRGAIDTLNADKGDMREACLPAPRLQGGAESALFEGAWLVLRAVRLSAVHDQARGQGGPVFRLPRSHPDILPWVARRKIE